jgi:hypothetical protein
LLAWTEAASWSTTAAVACMVRPLSYAPAARGPGACWQLSALEGGAPAGRARWQSARARTCHSCMYGSNCQGQQGLQAQHACALECSLSWPQVAGKHMQRVHICEHA